MNTISSKWAILAISGLIITLLASPVYAGSRNAAAGFLLFSDSPSANGMGATTTTMVNEQSAIYNPGAMGVFNLDHQFSITSPGSTKWLREFSPGLGLKSWGVAAASPDLIGSSNNTRSTRIRLSAAFYRSSLKYPVLGRRTAGGTFTGNSFTPSESSSNISFAIGIDKKWRAGLGVTYKHVESKLTDTGAGSIFVPTDGNGSSLDLGVYVEIPLHELLHFGPAKLTSRSSAINYSFTPAVGIVRANLGEKITYFDPDQASPLPEVTRFGLSLDAGINRGLTQIASLRVAHDVEIDHVGSLENLYRYGAELGAREALFFRIGQFTQSDPLENVNTWGLGASLQGIISWFYSKNYQQVPNSSNGTPLINRFDLRLDYAAYSRSIYDGTEFIRVSFSYGT